MRFVKELIDIMWHYILNLYTITATTVVYDWDGEMDRSSMPAYVDSFGGSFSVSSGDESEYGGWLDFTDCGNPKYQLRITAQSVGLRHIEVLVDYARMINGQIEVTGRQRRVTMNEVDYAPKTLLWNVPIDKSIGGYARVRRIRNLGDMDVDIDVKSLGAVRIVPSTITIVDREVEEEGL